jgi:hypothetical protein
MFLILYAWKSWFLMLSHLDMLKISVFCGKRINPGNGERAGLWDIGFFKPSLMWLIAQEHFSQFAICLFSWTARPKGKHHHVICCTGQGNSYSQCLTDIISIKHPQLTAGNACMYLYIFCSYQIII